MVRARELIRECILTIQHLTEPRRGCLDKGLNVLNAIQALPLFIYQVIIEESNTNTKLIVVINVLEPIHISAACKGIIIDAIPKCRQERP